MKKRFSIVALAVALSLSAQEQSLLRFYNNDAAAPRDVLVTCGGSERTITIAPHASADIESACTFITPPDVTAVRADAEQQWNAIANDSCPSIPLLLPPFGCASGAASVAVNDIPGATYSWTVDGASITSGNGSSRIELKLGTGESAKVSVSVHAGDCTTTSDGVIKLATAPIVHDLAINSGQVFQPATITWQHEGDVRSQSLSGTDFDGPVALAPDATSYTYTPNTEGSKVVVLEAVSVTPVGTTAGGRRRATATRPVNATTCSNAAARLEYAIGNCQLPDFRVTVPSAVKPGGTFTAEINLVATPGMSFKWTVTNGTPAGLTDRRTITIVAGASGQVSVSVEVRTTETCASTLKKSVEITSSCGNPTATVAPLVSDCRKSQVKASFTGRAPFTGTWSDGLEFTTNENAVIRDVQAGGTYTLRSFHDAICDGTINGSPVMNPPGSVSISMKGSKCSNGKIVAKFIGTPPFSGYWSDSRETFTTNETSVEHTPVPGMPTYFLTAFHDANCTDDNQLRVSNSLTIADAPTVDLRVETGFSTLCSTPGRATTLVADLVGDPPIHVKWSDGLVQDLPYTPARRLILPDGKTSGSTTYSIVEASDAHCPAVIRNASLTVRFADWPYVVRPSGDNDNFMCSGTTSTATLLYPPPPGIPLIWSITNGTIVGGQGTGTLTWKTGAPGTDVTITAKYDYGMSDCATTGTLLPKPHVRSTMKAPVVSPSNIECEAGKSVDFTLLADNETEALNVYQGLTSEVSLPKWKDNPDGTHTLTYTYTNLTGAGTKTVTIDYFNTCENRKQAFFTVLVK